MWIKESKWSRSSCFLLLIFCLEIFPSSELKAQKRPTIYYSGAYQVYSLKKQGMHFKMFDFKVSNSAVKAIYFGKNGKQRYDNWVRQSRKRVLCYFAVGFAKDFENGNPPLGLCVDQGYILNRSLDSKMDGLVSISADGKLSAIDVDSERVYGQYNLRNSSEKAAYLSKISRSKTSIFQTQLMYTSSVGKKVGELKYGKRASRRFLAICKDQSGNIHHIIVDLIESVHLNHAALKARLALEEEGYEVQYLLNQDTGARNIMMAFDTRGKRTYSAPVDISKATQLLVYYWDY